MNEKRPGVHSGPRKRSLPIQQEFHAPHLRRKGATRTSMDPPPQAELGLDLGTKTAHFSETQALFPVIPHKGTKLGPASQRWGMGWSYQAHTHTRTGSETKGKSKAQLILNHCPWEQQIFQNVGVDSGWPSRSLAASPSSKK